MGGDQFSCDNCGLVVSFQTNWCGPWRGYWTDISTYNSLEGRWTTIVSHHSLCRFTANAYLRFMKRHILADLRKCPGA